MSAHSRSEPARDAPVEIWLVVAVAENGVIGRDGDLPWRMPSDLKAFRKLTMGKPLVMGRRTFEAIGRPLDGRANIVVTSAPEKLADVDVIACASVDEALQRGREAARESGVEAVMVIGGAQVYDACLANADVVHLTRIAARPEGDAWFPELDTAVWALVEDAPLETGERDEFSAQVCVYRRRA